MLSLSFRPKSGNPDEVEESLEFIAELILFNASDSSTTLRCGRNDNKITNSPKPFPAAS